jgi:hypothetical protein
MVKSLLLSLLLTFSFVVAYSQSTCPDVDKRNNGNGKWSSAPGDFRPTYNQNNSVSANFVGTQFEKVNVNPNLKSGELTLKWDNLDVSKTPAITKVFHTDASGKTVVLPTVFGPAAPTVKGEDKAIYCFYGDNLPNSGTLSLEFTDVKTSIPMYYCSFDLKEFKSVVNPIISIAFPEINVQPLSWTVLEDGVTYLNIDASNVINYKWQYSQDGSLWSDVSGDFVPNGNNLQINNRAKYNNYSFRVVLTNIYGTTISDVAKLTVDHLPTLTFDGTYSICDVSKISGLNLSLTGLAPWSISYSINNGNPITISDISTNQFTIPIQQSTDLKLTLISVSDKKYTNILTSNNVFKAFEKLDVFVSDLNGVAGDSLLNLYFTSTGNPTNFELLNGSSLLNGLVVGPRSINDKSYKTNPQIAGQYDYLIKVSRSESNCESDLKSFKINIEDNKINILIQPNDTTFILETASKAVVNVSALNAKNFVWEKSTNAGLTWSTLNGNDYLIYRDSLVIKNIASHNNELYRVTFSNSSSSVISNTSLLFVEKFPTVQFRNTVHCDVDILIAVPVVFEGTPPFELVYQVEGVPGEEAHFVPNIKTNVYNIIVGGLTKQTNIKFLRVNNRRYVNTDFTNVPIFTSYKKNTLKVFVDTLVDDEKRLVFKTTGDAYKTFSAVNGTTTFPGFNGVKDALITDSAVSFLVPNNGNIGKYNFIITMENENKLCYNKATVYVTALQNKLQILEQPVSQSYLENGNAIFALKSQFSTSYVWQYTFNDGVTWNEIKQGGNFLKVTKDSLVIANRLFYKNNKFRIVLYGKYENVTSNVVTLNVERKPIAFFESTNKCYTGKTKTAVVYLKGVAPFKISYVNEKGDVKSISNITKDVYTLTVDSLSNKLRLLSVSDTRFNEVALDSSNSITFNAKPIYRPYFKTACFKDSLVELLFSGASQPTTMTIKAGVNPIPGFPIMNDVAFYRGYKLTLPKNLKLGTYGFVISGSDGICTSDEVKLNLSMNAIPVMNVSVDKREINGGDSISLVATGADVVRWSPVTGLDNPTSKSVIGKPGTTTTYTCFGYQNGCVGFDTIKISVNSVVQAAHCNPVDLTLNESKIKSASCQVSDGSVEFVISGGSANNIYRVRKKNDNGSYTIITNPAFAPLNNILNEIKTITVSNLASGDYDVFAFCGNDSRISKVQNFKITSPCDSVKVVDTTKTTTPTTINYNCNDMVLTIDNLDIKPITCDYDFGSVAFTIQGGAPNFTYRLRRRNLDNTFTVITNPVFVSIGNKINEPKKVTIDQLTEGDYELYVYCSQDVSFFKSASFYIYKQGCRSALKDVISYYSFDNNDNDSIKRAFAPLVSGAVKDFDNYGNAAAAYKIFNNGDNLTFKDFIDIDTMKEYSISFWYKLLEMPKYNNSTIISIPNGDQSQRMELVADKNGYMKVQFGKSQNSITEYTNYKVDPSTWNQIVLTHRTDSSFVYVNDKKVGGFASEQLVDNNSDFVVGYDGSNKSLKFLFDEFKLYGKAISTQDVIDNFYADVRENCVGIRLNIEVDGAKLKFVVSYGSSNNKYRLRKKNSSGTFVSIYDQTFVSIYNKLGESKAINTDNLAPGIYDVYAYCGTDSKKYQGYEFIVDNQGNTSIYRKVTPTETIDISNENAKEVKEEIFLNVYPNPVDNIINIDIIGTNPTVDNEIRLYSSNGVLVHTENFKGSESSTSISVENYRPGIYVLEVHLENNRVERKQIIIN